jgi:O-methyltransferase
MSLENEILPQNLARVIKRFGYDLIRAAGELPPHLAEYRHAPVLPVRATYSPWLTDTAFQNTFEQVSANTLVDRFRCYELWSLVGQARKLDAGGLIEVGVWRGGTGCLIAQAAKHFGIPERVYLCDTFEGVVKAGEMDTRYSGGEHSDTSEDVVRELAGRLGLQSVTVLKGIFPDDTAHAITEPALRFAHLDVDVYQSTKDILEWLWPRLVAGGLVVFDDYGTHGCEGVTRVVNEFSVRKDALLIQNLNGHAVVVKREAAAI